MGKDRGEVSFIISTGEQPYTAIRQSYFHIIQHNSCKFTNQCKWPDGY